MVAGCIDTGNPVVDHNARKLATKHRRLCLIVVSESRATGPHSSMRTGTQRRVKGTQRRWRTTNDS